MYFYTPSELTEKGEALQGKALRVGGMVEEGSVRWDAQQLLLTFALTDGREHRARPASGDRPGPLQRRGGRRGGGNLDA